MATTASFSVVLATDDSHSYAWIASAATGLNTFGNYEASLTAGDQIEYESSSDFSVSTNGSYTATGALSARSFQYRRWSSVSSQWGDTATAVFYPANQNIPVGAGTLAISGAQPSLYRNRLVSPGAGSVRISGIQQLVAGQLSNYSSTLSVVLLPDDSHSYVTLTSISSGPGFLSASPSLAIGNQIEYETYMQSSGGTTGKMVYVQTDGSFYTDTISALQVITFKWRYWSSGSWSNTATATVDLGGQVDVFIPSDTNLSIVGNNPTLALRGVASLGGRSLSISGQQPTVLVSKTIGIGSGTISFLGQPSQPINPPAGAGFLSIVGQQPTVVYDSAPPINPNQGNGAFLIIESFPVGLHLRAGHPIQSATISFEGFQPTIVSMGRWETTSAYAITWS